MTIPHPPPAAQWIPPTDATRRASNSRVAIALAVLGILIATAALVIGIIDLTRPTSSGASKVSATPVAPPSFTPEQIAAAKKELCTVFQVASRSVQQDTNGTDIAVARISTTNAAGMLDAAADNPALGQSEGDAARNLAAAYRNVVALASIFDKGSPVIQSALDDANRADAAMAATCR